MLNINFTNTEIGREHNFIIHKHLKYTRKKTKLQYKMNLYVLIPVIHDLTLLTFCESLTLLVVHMKFQTLLLMVHKGSISWCQMSVIFNDWN